MLKAQNCIQAGAVAMNDTDQNVSQSRFNFGGTASTVTLG
jgi:hypothetical protein